MPYLLMYTHILASMLFENSKIDLKTKFESKNFFNVLEKFLSFECSFTLLFLFAALRGNGDADYFNYINGVSKIQTLDNLFYPVNYPFEFGFRFLSLIVNQINANPQLVLAMMNLISFGMVYYFINKNSKNRCFSLMIFFPIVLLFDMHHSRSAIAISSGLVFFDSMHEKKYFRAIMFFVIGMLFHKSAIIMLFLITVPFMNKITSRLDSKRLFKYSIIIIVASLLFVSVVDPLSLPLSLLNNKLTFAYYNKLSAYLANERWSYKFSLFDPRLILMLLVFFLSGSQYKKSTDFIKNLIMIQFYSILTILLFRHSTILVIRIYNFFNIFTIVLIPNIIATFDVTLFLDSFGVSESRNRSSSKIVSLFSKVEIYKLFILASYALYTLALITKQVDYVFYFN